MYRNSPRLLYLDQHCWTRLVDDYPDVFRWLETLVHQDRVVVPISVVHVMETLKAEPATRRRILHVARRLTGDLGLVGPLKVLALEAKRHRFGKSLDWLRARLLTPNMVDLVAPAGLAWDLTGRIFSIRSCLDLHERTFRGLRGLGPHVDPILRNAARVLNHAPQPNFPIEEVARTVKGAPRDPRTIRSAFRSLTARETMQLARLQVSGKRFEPNDIMDLAFLSVTLPYFDLTVVDKAMHGVASYAIKRLGAPAHGDPAVVELNALRRVLERLI